MKNSKVDVPNESAKMKLFSDESGKFQMFIPIDWEYKNPSFYKSGDITEPHAFGLYDNSYGAFQMSCKEINPHIEQLIRFRNEISQSSDSSLVLFSEQAVPTDKQWFYAFSAVVDDHYFFATYIAGKVKKFEKKVARELESVRRALTTIKFIKPEFRDIVIRERRFELFMTSIAAIVDLKAKAVEKPSFLEYVVFTASHIDAFLRLALILSDQLRNNHQLIDLNLLYQKETDKPIMERKIYEKCLNEGIIPTHLFQELERLYKERNKVIHRFIITDIRTEDILSLAVAYGNVFEKVDSLIDQLEKDQITSKKGIWGVRGNMVFTEDAKRLLLLKIRDKHGRIAQNRTQNHQNMKAAQLIDFEKEFNASNRTTADFITLSAKHGISLDVLSKPYTVDCYSVWNFPEVGQLYQCNDCKAVELVKQGKQPKKNCSV